MAFAIISDIHSNLEALNRAMEYIKGRDDIDDIIILGDIVGYGANPNECIRLCRDISETIVLGNHDKAVFDLQTRSIFNLYAAQASKWTEDELEENNILFLKNLPLTISKKRFLFVHSSPYNPSEWAYVSGRFDVQFLFSIFNQNICFIGHTHIPVIYGEKKQPEVIKGKYYLSDEEKYIINVGSIGQPRDRNPDVSFSVFNENDWSLEYIRLDYDVKKAGDKIIEAGLHPFLAERLYYGY